MSRRQTKETALCISAKGGNTRLTPLTGGESGIRTLGEFYPTQHFECCTFDHSDNSPYKKTIRKMRENCEISIANNDIRKETTHANTPFADLIRDRPYYVSSAPRYDRFDTSP